MATSQRPRSLKSPYLSSFDRLVPGIFNFRFLMLYLLCLTFQEVVDNTCLLAPRHKCILSKAYVPLQEYAVVLHAKDSKIRRIRSWVSDKDMAAAIEDTLNQQAVGAAALRLRHWEKSLGGEEYWTRSRVEVGTFPNLSCVVSTNNDRDVEAPASVDANKENTGYGYGDLPSSRRRLIVEALTTKVRLLGSLPSEAWASSAEVG
jgi:hypothetical protein